ncbi:MAG: ribonuclease HII [Rhodoluna sp.]
MSSKTFPSLNLERELWASGVRFVIGMDEVGRGAIAGPVAVGVAILDSKTESIETPWPANLKDSKLLSEKARNEILEPVKAWVSGHAVGLASAQEIDSKGIVQALALSAGRALDLLLSDASLRQAIALEGAIIILDGSHNWLGAKASGIPVIVRTKADRDCVSVAAASVISKVQRDNLMIGLAEGFPDYGFDGHKGYAAESHIRAIKTVGPSSEHRHTWLTKILGDGQLNFEE